MGIYLNPNNDRFRQALNSEIYVDKSGLISVTNKPSPAFWQINESRYAGGVLQSWVREQRII